MKMKMSQLSFVIIALSGNVYKCTVYTATAYDLISTLFQYQMLYDLEFLVDHQFLSQDFGHKSFIINCF